MFIYEDILRAFQKRKVKYILVGGIAAVDIFQKEKPQINLIDIHMPYSPIDGVETLRRIKEIDKNAVCIMVTRITEKDKVEGSRQHGGAFAYLLKPMDLEELDSAINAAKAAIPKD